MLRIFPEVKKLVHFGHLIQVLHCCTTHAVTQALSSMDLTASQGRLMGYLAHSQTPPCPRDIEEVFHLSHPTVSGLLSRLEKKGFLELRPDAEDRRCKRVYLLPKGKECIALMDSTIQKNEEQMILDFLPEEQAEFSAYLTRAIQNMRHAPNPNHQEDDNT